MPSAAAGRQILLHVDAGPWGPGRTDTDTAEILGGGCEPQSNGPAGP